MAIEIKQQKKSNFGLWLAILILVLIAGWLAWSFLKPVSLTKQFKIEDLIPSSQLIPAQLDIKGVLNNPVFQTLTAHITWPLSVPPLGRSNPFQPF